MATKPSKAGKPVEALKSNAKKIDSKNKPIAKQPGTLQETANQNHKISKSAVKAVKAAPAEEPVAQALNTKPVKKTPVDSQKTTAILATEAKSATSAKKGASSKGSASEKEQVSNSAEIDQAKAEDTVRADQKSAATGKVAKQVIVPSKPAINPKPVAEKKAERDDKPVVIPKTSTSKVVDYEPEFIKSVLDTPVHIPSIPTMRYSDSELGEFRELINKKLEAAKKELAYLQGLITRKDEMGGDESDNRYMTMEDGSMSMEREQLSQMASRQITFIDHLEKAIMRIENKTYGICRVTGKLIDKARLRAVPHATLSMEAKLGIVK